MYQVQQEWQGQRLLVLLETTHIFDVLNQLASPRSAGKKYADLMEDRWKLDQPIPEYTKEFVVEDLYKQMRYQKISIWYFVL